MSELWKYHKDDKWQYVLSNIVPIEFEKNMFFYEHIKKKQKFFQMIYAKF